MSGRERSLLPRLRLGGAAATFFMPGEHERARPGLAAEVAQAGHEVALYGDAHPHLLARSRQDTRGDLVRGLATVAAAPGSWRTTVAALPLLAAEAARHGLTGGPVGEHGLAAGAG